MADRITIRDLNVRCGTLNKITGSPATFWNTDNENINVGHYYIDRAYGGFSLERTTSNTGAVMLPLSMGHIPARDLYNRINAYISGIELGMELPK